MNKNPNPINRSATVGCGAQLIRQYPRGNLSVLALLIFGILGSPCASAAFTPEVIGEEVTGETLESRDTQNIRAGGIANNTTINSSGEQYVHDGGIANDTIIYMFGAQYINEGGIANDTTLNEGGYQFVYDDGIANDTTINDRGGQNVIGGIANNTTINDNGKQVIIDGGIANNTTLYDRGAQFIGDEGIANNTTMYGNGWQFISDEGIANDTTIYDDGHQEVYEGTAHNTTIYNNGRVDVYAGGRLTGQTTVNDRGTMTSYDSVIHNEGEVIFQRSDDYTLNFDLTGTGGLTLNGPHTLTLSTASSYSGATTVNGGIIKAGADNVFSASSDYITQAGGSLDLDGYHQTLQSLNNTGTVNFGGMGGNTLTITGDYTGNNGLLNMNSVLEDDSSVTDKLIIAGNTAGNTYVQVNNLGGSGAQTLNGIELITVGGVSEGEFTQQGRIAAGAYDYYLQRGAGSNAANWYLSNAIPTETPEVPGEPSPPLVERPEASGYSANLAAANNMFVTRLHDRLGETHYIDALTGDQKVTSLWLRNEGGHNRSRDSQDQLRTQSNRYVMQLGGDIAQWSHTGADRFHLGLMAGYGNSKSTSESRLSGYSARASVDGYSTGVYGTWYANSADKTGLYVDSWAQYSWFNNTVNGQGLATEEYKSKGVTASVESGYTFKVGENAAKNASYFIQPKAQVTWMGVKADDHQEANGTNISGEGNGNIQTRLGVKAFMNGYAEQDKGKDRVFQPFVEANWVHNTKDFGTTMDGVTVKQDGAANIAELKLGIEGQLSKKVNLWGNVGQQVGNKGYSDTAVMLGVKYNF
ncbi:autotransporter outer membrane beta-barrel domain-containing protein [Yersinia frederiksenii]|uniref:autotransporter outer membrane beta-barrel domain-containing protein n=1 Tax=Yersinia frederiksenii TaxID=29484 RepID=UPI0025AA4614|nr:autotransporter outer membrane beta-barrel domain-containing protein [Yersinia frederiksenii]MDN0121057.1 autotransporter outer membrane beta-barrel domain-containing protein [Yersinia frederiksenii]